MFAWGKGLSDNAVYPQYIVAYINNQYNILGVLHYFPTAPLIMRRPMQRKYAVKAAAGREDSSLLLACIRRCRGNMPLHWRRMALYNSAHKKAANI